MRLCFLVAATLALAGCGARPTLGAGTQDGGTTPAAQPAILAAGCAPNDGPALLLEVGWTTCTPSSIPQGFVFLISSFDLQSLQAGSTLSVVDDINAPTQGNRADGMGNPPLSGTLDFTTFVSGTSATGSFDVTWSGGAASGSFDATWCDGGATCGG